MWVNIWGCGGSQSCSSSSPAGHWHCDVCGLGLFKPRSLICDMDIMKVPFPTRDFVKNT